MTDIAEPVEIAEETTYEEEVEEVEDEEAEDVEAEAEFVGDAGASEVKLFGKWSFEDIEVRDISLEVGYVTLRYVTCQGQATVEYNTMQYRRKLACYDSNSRTINTLTMALERRP